MRYAMLYNSASGNTRLVAEALERALTQAGAEVTCAEISRGGAAEALAQAGAAEADAVLVGFWCDKGCCTQDVADALAQLGGKRVFLFGTAGFGGAPEYFERILAGVREKLPADAEYLGGAMCQGKMGPGIRRRYEGMLAEKPGDARIQAMIANFDAALAHPDDDDLARIAAAARAALGL
ncbi:flavodoxin family protein BilS [Enorma burkinafasonensis]|uniref:flavodoxin family protein BilS n=1 Tax=Enorma burkinafasonensis TaxID=2590867 RepID=UPI0026ED5021|nr:flavodoxin family protein BilS [Enorma burkinafasonensis]MCI7729971.1 flavodoxin family protein [Enorma burkinafasonensis]